MSKLGSLQKLYYRYNWILYTCIGNEKLKEQGIAKELLILITNANIIVVNAWSTDAAEIEIL